MSHGYLAMVLHAHLPFVRHPEFDEFLEEDWLYEAITETYIPLLEVFTTAMLSGYSWSPKGWTGLSPDGPVHDPLLVPTKTISPPGPAATFPDTS